ncbi:MAG: histidinol-phosphate transaminase [Propionibacteriaceae bacterium]|jgi:histidinol-phosphate aminotransferase|nr:histidinol-phosphate transaminase [Propionibacteriaceae bacterium]
MSAPGTRAITLADLPLRPELRGEEPYGAPQLDVPVCLNVNENPYPPSPSLREHMGQAVAGLGERLNRYPDREAVTLRTKLADYLGHGLTYENVWAANGSNEIMVQILQAFGGPERSVLTFTPSYSMYPEYARDTHTRYVTAPRTLDFRVDVDAAVALIASSRPDVVVVATPNNPTGTVTEPSDIARILEVTSGIVVVDEAYQEFSSAPSCLELLPDYPRLIVSRTMSKAFAFAGGRLGYAGANPSIVDALRIVRLPYHLSGLTQVVACVALDHADELLSQVAHLRDVRDASMARLREVGLDVVNSASNFYLFGRFADRHAVWQGLLDQGVLVRETGPDGYLRVCAGTDEEMERFHLGLERVLDKARHERIVP